MLDRRRMLALSGGVVVAGGAAGVLANAQAGGSGNTAARPMGHRHALAGNAKMSSKAAATPFSTKMPVPQVLKPVGRRTAYDLYEISLQTANVDILPGLTTPAITYNGSFMGPTIRAKAGRPVKVRYVNRLDKGANVHLHGAHVAPSSDGYPTDLIAAGASRVYDYPNKQLGSTLWYHDHTHHMEAEHVYKGMHGFYLIEGADEQALNLPSGAYDVPIMIRDAHFDAAGGLILDVTQPQARSTFLANGKPQPYFQVAARKYRFRLLNASIYRTFDLDLGGVEMVQIASDGGLLPEPVRRTKLKLAPAERAEIVVDFSRHPIGSKLVLSEPSGPVMRFDVNRIVPDTSTVPARLRALPPLATPARTRQFKLGVAPSKMAYAINDLSWDANRVDTTIKEGTTEIWQIYNADTADSEFGAIDHTFHLHLVQFRVLDRDGKPPLPGEEGFKDTVLVNPGETVRLQATFKGYPGRYVYHCHMQEHNVAGMMAQMEIVP
ncbi:multicopper oxidase family protein [Streptomyces katsurahamanus]|uniref:Multicopper oxidase CueO n=1 Tax=Streptomyces katsurahamanus TaxID=2577098 RepID=A0ABW9NNA7_9ACTN|nr:multicopper oxidase family protein [Streptomyces katsurahamanus]MQS34757.1 multicopper oxidase family protein [Streptomyces katsurahamanus]